MSRREYQEMLREERRKRKNMKKTFLLIIGVLLFAFALSGLGLYIGYKLFNKKEKKPEITSAFIDEHNKYPLGVCIRKDIHDLFHSIYGRYNNTQEQWERFKEDYKMVFISIQHSKF